MTRSLLLSHEPPSSDPCRPMNKGVVGSLTGSSVPKTQTVEDTEIVGSYGSDLRTEKYRQSTVTYVFSNSRKFHLRFLLRLAHTTVEVDDVKHTVWFIFNFKFLLLRTVHVLSCPGKCSKWSL